VRLSRETFCGAGRFKVAEVKADDEDEEETDIEADGCVERTLVEENDRGGTEAFRRGMLGRKGRGGTAWRGGRAGKKGAPPKLLVLLLVLKESGANVKGRGGMGGRMDGMSALVELATKFGKLKKLASRPRPILELKLTAEVKLMSALLFATCALFSPFVCRL
jgi:hypothetical protein